MIRIFCNRNTPRIQYIFNFILHTICGFTYEITSNKQDYCSYNGPTLNYSSENLKDNDIEIRPNGLLQLETISICKGSIRKQGTDIKLFLKGNGLDENCFDLFAASFYLLSRYEEYLDYEPDAHGRFEAQASLSFKANVLDRPVINEWAETLKSRILKTYGNIPYKKSQFSCKISIDLDQAFAFQHRGITRNVLSFAKNTFFFNPILLKSQLLTLSGKKDPFNTFDYLINGQKKIKIPFIYFINVGAYSKYDKNLSITNNSFRDLLKKIAQHAEVGVHPSYFSNAKPYKFKEEKEALEQTIGHVITQSRQHYLKLLLPQTYYYLMDVGITEDFSMGYASHPGFRAGTCHAFTWFDLPRNKATTLKIFPAVYMENTFATYLHQRPEQALLYMKQLTDTVRLYKGCHISIWHNHTLSNLIAWKGWKSVYEASLQYIIEKG